MSLMVKVVLFLMTSQVAAIPDIPPIHMASFGHVLHGHGCFAGVRGEVGSLLFGKVLAGLKSHREFV
jgi:hypothetical protein